MTAACSLSRTLKGAGRRARAAHAACQRTVTGMKLAADSEYMLSPLPVRLMLRVVRLVTVTHSSMFPLTVHTCLGP